MSAPKGNSFAIGNSGREKLFPTVKDLEDKIDEYFEFCDARVVKVYDRKLQEVKEIEKQIPYTIEGLCEVLGCDRETVLNYEKTEGYEEYFGTIKRAKMKIQRNKLERGLDGESNPTMSIFDLKNNSGYVDKSEKKLSGDSENPVKIIIPHNGRDDLPDTK